MTRLPLRSLLARLACGLRRRAAAAAAAPVDLGVWGEGCAADWLRGNGWKILGRRVRPNRRDELDLVAEVLRELVAHQLVDLGIVDSAHFAVSR